MKKVADNFNANMVGFGASAKMFALSGVNTVLSLTHAVGTLVANLSAEGQYLCLKGINKDNTLRDNLEIIKGAEVESKHLYQADAETLMKSGILPDKNEAVEVLKRMKKKEFTNEGNAISDTWASINTKAIEL